MLPSTRPPLPPGRPVIDKVSKDEEDGSKTNWADYSQSENTDAEDKPTREEEEEEAETTLNSEKASVDDELYVDIPSPKGDGKLRYPQQALGLFLDQLQLYHRPLHHRRSPMSRRLLSSLRLLQLELAANVWRTTTIRSI